MKSITTKQLIETCKQLHACPEAIKWLTENKKESVKILYNSCDRGDWLLWLFAKLEIDRKVLVLVLCDCAESVLKYIPEGEDRPRVAIETARKWCRGEATLEEVKSAADAAVYVAGYVAGVAGAAGAAGAAARAARAACAAARVQKQTLKQCANIARQYVSYSMFIELLGKKSCQK